MVFSSPIFLFAYLPITLAAYFLSPFKYRNLVLFIVSLFFYGWGEPKYIAIMLYSIAVAYGFGFLIDKYRDTNKNKAKKYLIISILLNLAVLVFFKYCNFFIENLANIPFLSGLTPIKGLKLPVGISFYTFQIMSYSIDLYRNDAKLQKNVVSFGAYVTMFPQLIAGPIVRYQDVDKQLRERTETVEKFAAGIRTFSAGLAKKVLLANAAGALCDYYSASLDSQSTVLSAWLVVIFYMFQIYFDFSGYSDMAIGLGRMFAFELLENFNYPYISKSITDFWRRWHISLSTWFREYLYYPLGGNRKGKLKTYRNIAIVWFATGFWHGANWNFIMWGVYFAVILIAEKLILLKMLEKLPVFFRHCYALLFILLGWLIFYFTDIGAMASCFKAMFGINASALYTSAALYRLLRNIPLLLICIIASTPYPKRLYTRMYEKSVAFRYASPLLSGGAVILSVAYLLSTSYNPFIYYIF